MAWSLFENGKELEPLVFSNGKSQEDVVNEVVSAVRGGKKIVFIKGVCGSGKSVVALNVARELGRASVVVPVKGLQKQYEEDYVKKKYLMKNSAESSEKLKIAMISGRRNFKCKYLKENEAMFSLSNGRDEKVDAKLSDFTSFASGDSLDSLDSDKKKENSDLGDSREELERFYSCDNDELPCKIELKGRNVARIREYVELNPDLKMKRFFDAMGNFVLRNVRRMTIAPVCPYWSPVVEIERKLGLDGRRRVYEGLKGRKYVFYKRREGCGYYGQFNSYLDDDVLIFNSAKYILETVMGRKPATDVEIIDECDEFLDSFANEELINLSRLRFSLRNLGIKGKNVKEILGIVEDVLNDPNVEELIGGEKILMLKDTPLVRLFEIFLKDFMKDLEVDEENYLWHCDEVARIFESFLDEAYVLFEKGGMSGRNLIVRVVTINLEKRFKELLEKNKAIVMMSGTIHSSKVLKEIFGLEDFEIIEAESKTPGKVFELRTGKELNCKYSNFKTGICSREQYLRALEKCLEIAKRPVLVHVNSFGDLPSDEEVANFSLKLMSRERLKELQAKDSKGEVIREFKEGKLDVLYSTKCNRGVDFPGSTCRSIVLTKYPYPAIRSLFWRLLRRTKPGQFNEFYLDKSNREFLQRIYRGLRSRDDTVFLLSPDSRVFGRFV